ncbi:MAG: ATP-binding protein [Planctomycetota bacterium]|nr:MAG: ATP-binding protein [Planctomycetota bacterium]
MTQRILVSWSTGKDSSWMLHQLQQRRDVELVGLLTTFNEEADRVAMHAVRRELTEAQADAAGLPLWPVMLPSPCSHELYAAAMSEVMARARSEGVTHVAFGDLYLTDIRAYRERQMQDTGLAPVFPLWGGPEPGGSARVAPRGPAALTPALARCMLDAGLRAVLTAVDPVQLDPSFVGRPFDAALLADLPPSVDPCGENGEFHTFCWDGPMFRQPIPVQVGERVERGGFWFADLVPATTTLAR